MIRDWTKRRVVLLSIWLASTALAGGCREAQVKSVWREQEIAIDGLRADWQGIDVYNFGDKQVLLGVANDSESIYVLLVTSNRTLGMAAMNEGFTASFSMDVEAAEVLSVGYALQRQILIFGPAGQDTLRLDPEEAARCGIEERAGYKDGYFALEMKVPLRRDAGHPHAVGMASGAPAQIGENDLIKLSLRIPKRKGGSMAPGDSRGHGSGRMYSQGEGDEDPDDSGFPGRGGHGGRHEDGPGERRPPSTSGGMANGLDLTLKILLCTGPGPHSGQ